MQITGPLPVDIICIAPFPIKLQILVGGKPLSLEILTLFARITFDKILGVEECYSQDRILTLISFLIYNEWLLFSLADKKRNSRIMLDVYKNELALRLKIYEASSGYDPYETEYINLLIDLLS